MKQVILLGVKLHRTEYAICVGKKNGYDVYNSVYTADNGKYYVKSNKKIFDVTEDQKFFHLKRIINF